MQPCQTTRFLAKNTFTRHCKCLKRHLTEKTIGELFRIFAWLSDHPASCFHQCQRSSLNTGFKSPDEKSPRRAQKSSINDSSSNSRTLFYSFGSFNFSPPPYSDQSVFKSQRIKLSVNIILFWNSQQGCQISVCINRTCWGPARGTTKSGFQIT